jgi:hypothetical protein
MNACVCEINVYVSQQVRLRWLSSFHVPILANLFAEGEVDGQKLRGRRRIDTPQPRGSRSCILMGYGVAWRYYFQYVSVYDISCSSEDIV